MARSKTHYIDVLSLIAVLGLTLATLPRHQTPDRPMRSESVSPCVRTTPCYTVIDIGKPANTLSFEATAISPRGKCVAGIVYTDRSHNNRHVMVWKRGASNAMHGSFIDLGASEYDRPAAVNDAGIVVGQEYEREPQYSTYDKLSRKIPHAVIWQNGIRQRLFPNGNQSTAVAIDNAGNIYGDYKNGDGINGAYRRDPQENVIALGSGGEHVLAANENGQVLMMRSYRLDPEAPIEEWCRDTKMTALVWNGGKAPITEHENLAASEKYTPRIINESGEIVGFRHQKHRCVPGIWQSGSYRQIPTPDRDGIELGVDAKNNVVGLVNISTSKTAPYLFFDHQFYYLNNLVEPGVRVETPRDMTQNGVIFALGTTPANSENHVLLLVPR